MSIGSEMPSNHLILYRPLFLLSVFLSSRVFSSESALRIRWPKYWSFSFSISPSSEFSGLIYLLSRGFSRVLSTNKSTNSSVLNLLYGPPVTSICDYWKNHSFDYVCVLQICFFLPLFLAAPLSIWDLSIPTRGIKLALPAVETQGLNYWTSLGCILDSTYVILYGICFSLSDLLC